MHAEEKFPYRPQGSAYTPMNLDIYPAFKTIHVSALRMQKSNPADVFEEIPDSFEETINEAKRRFSLQS